MREIRIIEIGNAVHHLSLAGIEDDDIMHILHFLVDKKAITQGELDVIYARLVN